MPIFAQPTNARFSKGGQGSLKAQRQRSHPKPRELTAPIAVEGENADGPAGTGTGASGAAGASDAAGASGAPDAAGAASSSDAPAAGTSDVSDASLDTANAPADNADCGTGSTV